MSYQEAYIEYKWKNYKAAITKFSTYLKNFPKDPDAYFYLGISYMRIQDFKNALINFRKVIQIIPKEKQAWQCMEKIYTENLNDKERAEQCENYILPSIPFDAFVEDEAKIREEIVKFEETDDIILPHVIVDSSFLIKLFEVKKDYILFLFRQASEFFNFITSEQKRDEFINKSSYQNREIYGIIDPIEVKPTDLYEFEKKVLGLYAPLRKIKDVHENIEIWYNNLSLAQVFLKQNAKKLILVSDDKNLQRIFQELKLTCIYMSSDKFWVYLRYKLRRKYNRLFYME